MITRALLRAVVPAGGIVLLAACGGVTAASSPSTGASPGARGGNRGAFGELVQINGKTLILNSPAGDATVVYSDSTVFRKTSTGSFSDIAAGKCILAAGQKDASGNVVASVVTLSDKVNGACTVGGGGPGGNGGNGGFGFRSPRPGFTPAPGFANLGFARGEVTAVSGTTVTVKDANGTSQSVTVPTTVQVAVSTPVTAAALELHVCIQAGGARDSSGTVNARTINISPLGASGTCATGRRFGGFGGGGGGGGGGGFGGPPGGSD